MSQFSFFLTWSPLHLFSVKSIETPSFTFRLSFQLTCQPHAMWKWSWLRKNKSSHVLKKKSKLRKFPRRSLLVKNLKPVNKSQPFIYKLHLCLVFSFSSNIFNLTFYYYHGFVSFLFFRFQKRDFLYELLTDVSFLNQKWIQTLKWKIKRDLLSRDLILALYTFFLFCFFLIYIRTKYIRRT